jgi:hypothetical protein
MFRRVWFVIRELGTICLRVACEVCGSRVPACSTLSFVCKAAVKGAGSLSGHRVKRIANSHHPAIFILCLCSS